MATVGQGAADPGPSPSSPTFKSSTQIVIEISDDDEDAKATTNGTRLAAHPETVNPEPKEQLTDNHDDAASDSSSLLADILNSTYEDDVLAQDDEDMWWCTPEESIRYRIRLREVGINTFVEETISAGTISAKKLCTAFGVFPPPFWNNRPDVAFYRLLGMALMRELQQRQKLPQYNTIDDAAQLLLTSKKIIVITGAGISTSLGIPDFRSKDTGFYAKMRAKGYENGEEVFDIHHFEEDPREFYENCGDTLPQGNITSPTHTFIRLLQDKDKLLTNYTQNIDNIEANAGIDREKLIQCHGSWATATCRKCRYQMPGRDIFADVQAQRVPKCPRCVETLKVPVTMKRKRSSGSGDRSYKSRRRSDDSDSSDDGRYDLPEPGVMKPDITFFGEPLPPTFFNRFRIDRHQADLVVVIGTSMNVAPVSEIPMAMSPTVPHIYISRTLCPHINFDVTLLGDCDTIVAELALRAKWILTHGMLPEDRSVDIIPEDEEKGIWRVLRPDQEAGREEEVVTAHSLIEKEG